MHLARGSEFLNAVLHAANEAAGRFGRRRSSSLAFSRQRPWANGSRDLPSDIGLPARKRASIGLRYLGSL
jgi:hypothetical protein